MKRTLIYILAALGIGMTSVSCGTDYLTVD